MPTKFTVYNTYRQEEKNEQHVTFSHRHRCFFLEMPFFFSVHGLSSTIKRERDNKTNSIFVIKIKANDNIETKLMQ